MKNIFPLLAIASGAAIVSIILFPGVATGPVHVGLFIMSVVFGGAIVATLFTSPSLPGD